MKLKEAYNKVFGEEKPDGTYEGYKNRYKPPFFEQHEDIDSLAHWVESGVAAVLVYKTFFTYRAVTLSRAPIAQFDVWKIKRVDIEAAIDFIEQKKGTVDPALKPMLEAQRGPYVCEIFLKEVNWRSNSSYTGAPQTPKGGIWYELSSTGYRFYKKGREFTLFRARYVDASYTRGKPLFVKADSSTLREFIDCYFKSVPESEKEKRKKNHPVVGKLSTSFSVRSGDLPEEVINYLKRKGLLFSV